MIVFVLYVFSLLIVQGLTEYLLTEVLGCIRALEWWMFLISHGAAMATSLSGQVDNLTEARP